MELKHYENIRSKLGLARVSKPALAGLTALLVMVAVFAGNAILETATANDIQLNRSGSSLADVSEVSEPSNASSSNGAGLELSQDGAAPDEESSGADSTVYVHVSGAVRKPGLVALHNGDRIADAIEAAGGPTSDARLESINLAQKVSDGEHVHVLSLSDEANLDTAARTTPVSSPSASSAGTSKVNINTATADELEPLPGIGPSTAQKIIAEREASGPFASVEDLTRVSGIGEKKLASIADLVCV